MEKQQVLKRGAFLRLTTAGTLGFVVGCRTGRTAAGTGEFTFTVLNPDCMTGGAGQCVVMRTPSGKTYLYDTGNGDFSGKSPKNNGRDIVIPYLRAHGIERIDGLVISHYHADHFGGLLTMWNTFPIAKIYNNNFVPDLAGLSDHDLREYRVPRKMFDDWAAAHPGCLVENTKEGDDLGWDEDDVSFEVVWPPRAGYVKPLADRKGYGGNDTHFHHLLNGNSTALRVTAGGRVFFIVGDIQADYVRAYMVPHLKARGTWGCDLAVLPSHGTKPEEVVKDFASMSPRPKTVIASLGNRPWMVNVGKTCQRVWTQAGYAAYVTNIHGDIGATLSGPVTTDASKVYPLDPRAQSQV